MNTPRVLIVDDEANVRETMRLALETAGHRVEIADDGQEGLLLFGAGSEWDLVLLDQRMPGMEGLDVLRRMRERDPEARIVMVTAYGTIELAVEAMKAGAVDFLRKPFTPEVLRGAVQAVLALPRRKIDSSDPSLARLLPPGPDLREAAEHVPLIHFRTLNGYRLWPVEMAVEQMETEALRIRRLFETLAPTGQACRCAVEISTSVRGNIREVTGQDFPPDHAIWDTLARSGLSHFLWERAELPPETLLVHALTREQLQTGCAFAGLHPPR